MRTAAFKRAISSTSAVSSQGSSDLPSSPAIKDKRPVVDATFDIEKCKAHGRPIRPHVLKLLINQLITTGFTFTTNYEGELKVLGPKLLVSKQSIQRSQYCTFFEVRFRISFAIPDYFIFN